MNLNKKVAFYTLGCKVNQYETESLKTKLVNLGYEDVSFDGYSDFYIVNSCTVTSIADKKTRNILRRAKKHNPNGKVIVTGCYAQTNGEELLNIEEVDYVVGNTNKEDIIPLVEKLKMGETNHLLVSDIFKETEYKELEFSTLREMSRAYIKIQDGCNNFCSYCKIPFGRGKSRSRNFENIISEANKLAEEGYKEIILIGINIGDYGKDLEENIIFEDLLEELSKIEKITRIRIGSIYPDRIDERFIKVMRNKKVMPHLHISLQSCDDTVLKAMRRNYGVSLIKERLEKLRREVDDIQYTADVIVGFPGETREMYENTKKVVQEIGFSSLHVFPYSEREKTLAATFNNQVPMQERRERVLDLEKAQEKCSEDVRKKYIGKDLTVLIEEKKNNGYFGYSENYLRVKILDKENIELKTNDEIKVKIISIEKELLIGEL
ncbi:tRNA (N(6)-L-threonylcarbamoyladenosine(37)-C(2))-methylthiotransferase MtaB [Fusobacterium sp.]|uniref:tRNA (N(6)-L-threonylcarbamoyladenosine(37)-C(2))- methylthiotransferase MtaB n=1 Tax=Fusobacterium sp. TaxID=68766 RepID=UPI00263048F9|nr:tRNA (N(6)-L-threonylcarbamoyladenosine(37)-C(2))-methylthiotransferase MtaB [Fusobacterium sp.]